MIKSVIVVAAMLWAILSGASVHAAEKSEQVSSVDDSGYVETYSGSRFQVSDPENYHTDDRLSITTDEDDDPVVIENEDTGVESDQQ